jgi:3-oxoacyl-[acyl-carrier protein] reductase
MQQLAPINSGAKAGVCVILRCSGRARSGNTTATLRFPSWIGPLGGADVTAMAVSRCDATTWNGRDVSGVLDGRTALVTGGSRGIGRAVVERLARDGATVVFGYRADEDAAEQTVTSVNAAGGRVRPVQADLAEPGAAARLWDAAEAFAAPVNILVNNAGIGVVRPLVELSDEDYERVMNVNARAVFEALREASRRMPDGGRIVNVSTVNTVMPGPGLSLYAASKGAVEQLTVIAAHELGERDITVNTVSPGATDTDMLSDHNSPEGREMMRGMSPLGRLGQPEDIADVIAFLVGPDGRWMTAQNLRAGGGIR